MSPLPGLPAERRRDFLRSVAAAAVGVPFAGCARLRDGVPDGADGAAADAGSSNSGDGPEFVVGSTSAAQGGLDPLAVGDQETHRRLDLLYDGGGVITDDPIEFQGRWLESWELADDAESVRYRVRDGLEWGAGYGPLTAETYLYNIEHVFTEAWSQYTQSQYYSIGGEPIEYERTGRLTFEATLPQPRANFLHEDPVISALLLPIDLVEEYEPTDGEPSDPPPRDRIASDPAVREANLVGNLGPFTLERYEKGSSMVVRANEDYYLAETDVGGGAFRGSPNLSGVTTEVFGERSTAYAALMAGDISATEVEARKEAEMAAASGVKVWTSTYGDGIFWISMNHRTNGWRPIRESRRVRQAFAHLLDTETLIDDIFDGNANPIDTFHPRWGPYYSDAKVTRYAHDVDRAKQLLEAGTDPDYGYDDSGAFVGPDGRQVELRFVTRSDSQTGDLVGNVMRQSLEEAGFEVSVRGLPFGTILETYFANRVENNPNYDGEPDWGPVSPYNGGPWDQATSAEPWDFVYGVGSTAAAYAPWQAIQGFLTERGSFNAFGYRTTSFDIAAAIDDAAAARSREEATTILEDLFGFLSEDLPFLWTRNNHMLWGYRDDVGGLPAVKNYFSADVGTGQPNVRLLSLE